MRIPRTAPPVIAGLALLLLGSGGLLHGISASKAHFIDWRERVCAGATDAEAAVGACSRAHQLYPYNHRICEWAAIMAYDAVASGPESRQPWYLEQSEVWCDVALDLNPYSGSLRRLKARFLERRDPLAAAAYWREYLDWVYWNEANHYVMVELYAAAGKLELAEDALRVIEGRRYHQEAEQLLYDAWLRREEQPSLPPPP